jgi:hypothetical protein
LVPELQRHSAENEDFRFDETRFLSRRNTETMDRTVREHLDDLEQKLLTLNDRMMDERNLHKRNELEAELRAVQSAVVLYRSALEVESRLSRN